MTEILVRLNQLSLPKNFHRSLDVRPFLPTKKISSEEELALSYHAQSMLRSAAEKKFKFTFGWGSSIARIEVEDGRHRKHQIIAFPRTKTTPIFSCGCEQFQNEKASLCEHTVLLYYLLQNTYNPHITNEFTEFCQHARKGKFSFDGLARVRDYCSLTDRVMEYGPTEGAIIETPSLESQTALKKDEKEIAKELVELPDEQFALCKEIDLYDYQKKVVRILITHGSGICAMAIGSGKTVATIGYWEWLRWYAAEKNIRIFVVCTKTLLQQWKTEIEQRAEKPLVQIIDKPSKIEDLDEYSGHHVAICTYGFLRTNIEAFKARAAYDMLVIDEIQYVRNSESKAWAALYDLAAKWNVPRRVALSGTVVENELDDLYNAMHIIDEKALPPKWRFDALFKNVAASIPSKLRYEGSRNNELLKKMLSHRLFSYDPPAPPVETKHHHVVVGLTPQEQTAHDNFMQQIRELQRRAANMEFVPRNLRQMIQGLQVRARQAANGMAMLGRPGANSKITKIGEWLHDQVIEQKKKVVCFSEWTTMLGLVEKECEEWCEENGVKTLMFTGKGSSSKRQKIKNEFINNPDAKILFCTDSAGVGLDGLQFVSYTACHTELVWNPAKLDQRNGRLVRNLQKHDVDVTYFRAANSIEDRMLELNVDKRALRSDTVGSMSINE